MNDPEIDVYIGTGPGMEPCNDALICSIMENTRSPDKVHIHLMEAWGSEKEWRWWHGQPNHFDPDLTGKGFWVTPFSLFRYAIPYVKESGYAVYLDADMIMLGDIQQLYSYREEGKWVCASNRDGDCVSVIHVDAMKADKHYPPFDQLKGGVADKQQMRRLVAKYLVPKIPETWNRHDDFVPGQTMLTHYTAINMQPWKPWPDVVDYIEHSSKPAVDLFNEWHERSKTWQLQVSV